MAGIKDNIDLANNPEIGTDKRIKMIKEGRTYQPDVDTALDAFNQSSKRNLKNKPKQEKRKFKGKDLKKIIAAITLSTLILIGAGAGTVKAVENKQQVNQIVEEYDANVDAIKSKIKDIIALEYEKALKEEGLTVEIYEEHNDSKDVSRIISVTDKDGNTINYTRRDDLAGGMSSGNNKSSKLDSIVNAYLGIENEKDAAKVLKRTEDFSKKRDLSVTNTMANGEKKSKVDDTKSDDFER